MKFIIIALSSLLSSSVYAADTTAALNAFLKTTSAMQKQLTTLKGAGSCSGLFGIGGRVAGQMDASLNGLMKERVDVKAAITQGAAGRGVIDAYAASAQEDNDRMHDNLNLVLMAFGGSDPNCVRAKTAFKALAKLDGVLPGELRAISALLN